MSNIYVWALHNLDVNYAFINCCRYPVFFDDIAARLLPVIPLIIYRLIENDATDISDRVLAFYSSLLNFHPLRFTFVRDILAYFYGHLPSKLIVRILKILDISKVKDSSVPLLLFFFSSGSFTNSIVSSDSFFRFISSACWFIKSC